MNMLMTHWKITLAIFSIIVCVGWTTTSYSQVVLSVQPAALTEADLDGQTMTLKLTDQTWINSEENITNALSVSGIEGVLLNGHLKRSGGGWNVTGNCLFGCAISWETEYTRVKWVDRVDDTTVTIDLKFDGDFETDSTLTFTVEAAAIENYDGPTLTAEVSVTSYKGVSASATPPLTEATLDGSTVELVLYDAVYEQDISKIREALTISGIDGVTIDTTTVQRLSDREATVRLDYDLTDFDTDAVLTFNVASGAIANYTGDDLTTEISVSAIKEGVSASATPPLTEANLDGSVVSLTLTGVTYERDIAKIRDAVSVSGIDGVTIDTATVKRLSNTEITVGLDYDLTDFDETTTLTFSVASGALVNYMRDDFTTEISVSAIKEVVSASVVSPLTEATLNGSTVELKITNAVFEQDISKIREALTVSGINGVTIDTTTLQRINNRKVTFELKFDGTDLATDTSLLFNVADGAITNHNGTLTTEILVTANTDEALLKMYWMGRYGSISRANLDGSNQESLGSARSYGIALDVSGGKMYWTDWSAGRIQRANLDGSNIEDLVTQGLNSPKGIALDVEGGKMYWTDPGHSWDHDIGKIQCANLDGSNVEDLVTREQVELRHPWGIALDVSGGKMYWTDWGTHKIQRANLDGSNIEDLVTRLSSPRGIALDVLAGKMYWTDYNANTIQRANLDGSNIEDLVTQTLKNPRGIALDVSGGKMYWTDWTDHRYDKQIRRANLDGSNIEDVITYLDYLTDIAIGLIPLVNPTPIAKEDVNRDGVVDLNDLVIISLRYGQTGNNPADVNGDGVVNVDDLILVAAVIDDAAAAAAPAARAKVESHFTETQLQGWLTEARASGNTSRTYQRGIAVIEQLLTLFTPEKTALLANYPNPFNPETWIPYQLSKPTDVTLTIYDIKGSVIRALDLGHQRAGLYQTRSRAAYWDGRNAVGEKVASGLYFYTLTAGEFTATRKMLIRK